MLSSQFLTYIHDQEAKWNQKSARIERSGNFVVFWNTLPKGTSNGKSMILPFHGRLREKT